MIILPDTSGLLEGALLIGVALGVLGHFFSGVPSRAMAFIRSKGLWFTVSMACYLIGVGGMVFCIIRNPKTHGFDQVTVLLRKIFICACVCRLIQNSIMCKGRFDIVMK